MEQADWEDLVRNDSGTKQARMALGIEIVSDLDTRVKIDQYAGIARPELVAALAGVGNVNGEAWKLAFMTYLEAGLAAMEAGCYENLGEVVDLIRWCRRSVELPEEFATGRWGRFDSQKTRANPGLSCFSLKES